MTAVRANLSRSSPVPETAFLLSGRRKSFLRSTMLLEKTLPAQRGNSGELVRGDAGKAPEQSVRGTFNNQMLHNYSEKCR